jgi:hypothetical protein
MGEMTAGDRNKLIQIAKGRAKLAKANLVEREKILLNETEEQLSAEFHLRDEVEAEVLAMAQEEVAKVNEHILNQARLLGYDGRNVPRVQLPYYTAYDQRTDKEKAAARKRAAAKLAAMRAAGNKAIDEAALNVEESLIVGGLESDEARDLVGTLPTAEQLIPPLSLSDLGIRTWQPSRDAAKELLAAPTGADRRRTLVMRALAANPGASDRQIAKITGFDHKTVAKYRAEEVQAIDAGSPAPGGEVPTDAADHQSWRSWKKPELLAHMRDEHGLRGSGSDFPLAWLTRAHERYHTDDDEDQADHVGRTRWGKPELAAHLREEHGWKGKGSTAFWEMVDHHQTCHAPTEEEE